MRKKVVLTGATGLIGSHILKLLLSRNDEVTVFTRNPVSAVNKIPGSAQYIKWNPEETGDWEKSLEGQDAVIHLAGASIFGKRWSEEYKSKILASRQSGTRGIVNAIVKAKNKPSVLVCASAIGYYGSSQEKVFSESDSPGNDFLANVCRTWESEASGVEEFNVRRISIRTGIVLDKHEGALERMLLPFRLFIGGPLGSGKQWFSWIHIEDIAEIYLKAIDDNSLQGAINATSPNPVTMDIFAKTLGKVINKPSWLKVPEFAMKIAVGEAAEFVTEGQKVIPQKLLNSGYQFKYPELEDALNNLLKE